MSITNDELRAEQQRVDEVRKLIGSRIETYQRESGGIKGEIISIRRNFWDDVTVNFEDAAETAETYASMKQQAEVLSERERRHRHLEHQLKTLTKLEGNPYFGRIDLKDADGPDEAESIYLGIGSLLDDSAERYLIYDWRAPISSVYYDYGPGPVRYETPEGTVGGEMTLKRQFMIRGGIIRSMFDTGLTIGDELLQEVLGQTSDSGMRSIVATIQQEQNRIIRNERAKLLIVEGAAGSGKTSAALQRIAYLLYRYRDTLSSEQVLLFSPNPMFNSYVSTVLPELGEQNMGQTTYQQYLEHRLGRSFRLEDPYSRMEYVLANRDDPDYEARLESIRFKSDERFLRLIDAYARHLSQDGMTFRDIRFRGRKLIPSGTIKAQFDAIDPGMSIPIRMRKLAEWLLKELTRLGKLEAKKKWVDEEIELLDKEAYIEAFQQLRSKNKFNEESFDDYKAERDFLAAKVVQEQFKKLRRRVKRLAFVDGKEIYRSLFAPDGPSEPLARVAETALPSAWSGICRITLQMLDDGQMRYEDATPYLYLMEKLEGFHTNTKIKHVFIDEAQDYSAFQYHYLKKIFPFAKMTVLGDSNQSIFAGSAASDGFEPLRHLFGEPETEHIVLKRSYRSTRQIVEFTSKMIEGGSGIIPFNRNGPEPVLVQAGGDDERLSMIADAIARLAAQKRGSVALLCKTAEESKRTFDILKSRLPEMKLIEKETATFEKGIAVIPSYLAKGVEFDAVVIADASAECYSREDERKLFYTACTRAMHELYLYYTGTLTPFISE